MTVFDGYARYYDLLYRDKDYTGEARHVHEVIQKHQPGAATLMEMGCGTGGHAVHLADLGYRVHGIDQSRPMLDQAARRTDSIATATASRLKFSQGDIRQVRMDERFDAVIALFHVISYLPTAKDQEAAITTACHHLKAGGIFFFDAWYGPAVLTDRPAVRIKRMADDQTEVLRIAEPALHVNENLVDVHYEILVRDRQTDRVATLQETHRMRYLFKPEVERLFSGCGLTLVDCFEWMSGRPPGCDTWGVCFVGRT
jgi:predicted TPR repeat methyltransferase